MAEKKKKVASHSGDNEQNMKGKNATEDAKFKLLGTGRAPQHKTPGRSGKAVEGNKVSKTKQKGRGQTGNQVSLFGRSKSKDSKKKRMK
jgi:hypothetical protein